MGTVLLRTAESGASATHQAALADPARTETVLTHAFTGRPARGLRNAVGIAFAPGTSDLYAVVNERDTVGWVMTVDWLTGPSTGLVRIGRERGYLPRYFQQVNAHGVQLRILVAQGIMITVIGLLYALIPTVSRAYWVFAALATEVYLIMYVLMFVSASRLRRRQPDHPRGYRAPALRIICGVGVLASVAACIRAIRSKRRPMCR